MAAIKDSLRREYAHKDRFQEHMQKLIDSEDGMRQKEANLMKIAQSKGIRFTNIEELIPESEK